MGGLVAGRGGEQLLLEGTGFCGCVKRTQALPTERLGSMYTVLFLLAFVFVTAVTIHVVAIQHICF